MNWETINKLIDQSKEPIAGVPDPDQNPERWRYYRFFYLLVKETNAKLCSEIGIEYCNGSKKMADAGALVLSIDIDKRIDYKNCIALVGDSVSDEIVAEAKKYADKHGGIDILYQDSSHHYLPSKQEWELYRPLMKDGGIWICDDITKDFYNPNPNPNGRPEYQDPIGKGMVQYWEEIPEQNKRLFPDVLHKGNTHGIILL